MNGFKVTRIADTDLVSYGPQSDLRVLVGDESRSTPIRVALQTCQPGYDVPYHCHPYTEYLIVLEGSADLHDRGPTACRRSSCARATRSSCTPACGTRSRPRRRR